MTSDKHKKVINRILLISTNSYREPFPVFPLALSYLTAAIKQKFDGIELRIFDFNTGDREQFNELLRSFQPNLVGISIRNIDTVNFFDNSQFIEENLVLIQEIREIIAPVIVLGGAGFSIFPEVIFNLLQPDFAICGEGEESFPQLIQCLIDSGDVSRIEGLLFRENGKAVRNKRVTFLSQPDLVFDDDLVDFYWQESGMMNIQTKRGCPCQCIYCTYPLIEGRTVRTHSPQKIVDTLKALYQQKGITYFFFADSIFNIQNEYNRELAERIIAADMDIQWGAYFAPRRLDPALMQLLKKSGLTHIEFGTESLSNSTLKSYNKNFRVNDVLESADICHQLRIHTAHFLILGGYGETENSLEETLQNSKRIEKTVFFPFFGMRIYPNTKIYQYAVAEGKIKAGDPLLSPVYYLADNIRYGELKKRARAVGKRWIFQDDNLSKPIEMMRKKGIKGPLWEMLSK